MGFARGTGEQQNQVPPHHAPTTTGTCPRVVVIVGRVGKLLLAKTFLVRRRGGWAVVRPT